MDEFDKLFPKQMQTNARRFQQSIERIAEKYSKLQYEDNGIDVDLNNTHIHTLGRYLALSKKKLNKLESMNSAHLREESLCSQDVTEDSQLNFTNGEGGANCNLESTCQDEDDVTYNDTGALTSNSLDKSQQNHTDMSCQPEEEDEQLEMSLESQGSSLGDLYPNMISQIGKAWRRQQVSEAADSVLRRYRRWRGQSNRTNLTSSFHSASRHTNSKKMRRETLINNDIKSPIKVSSGSGTVSQLPVKIVTDVLGQKTQHQFSPVRVRGPQRREPPPAPVVMDLSSEPDHIILNKTFRVYEPVNIVTDVLGRKTQHQFSPVRVRGPQRREPPPAVVMDLSSEPAHIMRNKTITVYEPTSPQRSQLEEHASIYTVSPSKSYYPTTKRSQELSFRMKESCLSPRHVQAAGCSVCASQNTLHKERPDIYGSPVRQSPYKSQTSRGSPLVSPSAFVASPKSPYVPGYSMEHKRQRSVSTSLTPSSPKIRVLPRALEYPDQQQRSPQLASRSRPYGLRRHLSFDSSSLPSSRASYTAKELDDDFTKLYHKFVCLNKSFFLDGPPCRVCAKSSGASRCHYSSNVAALALSPHRPVLRKRHRELDTYPQAKRLRESYCTYSPGSMRHMGARMREYVPPRHLEPQRWSSHSFRHDMATKPSPVKTK